MTQDSTHALWVDPLAFEPTENGAPYLPEKPVVKIANADGGTILASLLLRMPDGSNAAELGALVAILRAAAMVHQSHHWQTRGPAYYGDHLLFQRLYSESVGFIDQVAERAVGMGGDALVSPLLQVSLLPELVTLWCRHSEPATPEDLALESLSAERCTLNCLDAVIQSLTARGALSAGTDNLLQGVADKHEEFVYLLQQRAGVAYSYDQR